MARLALAWRFAVLSAALLSAPALSTAADAERLAVFSEYGEIAAQPDAARLLRAAEERGRIGVIVGLDLVLRDDDAIAAAEAAVQARTLARAQESLIARTTGGIGVGIRKFQTIPYIAIQATRDELARLLSDPAVTSITEDQAFELQLYSSTRVIKAPALWSSGILGKGRTVAVLDSGVSAAHPMLQTKLVSEACYSTNFGGYRSLCPNAVGSSVAPGSGRNCSVNLKGCEHGTHTASVAAGLSTVQRGVASRANIISIKVVSRKLNCTGNCLRVLESDLAAGLERVFALRTTFQVAAVNVSIGGETQVPLNCNGLYPAVRAIVGKLRNAGIATIVASGNASLNNQMYFPACLSDVVAVAATTDFDNFWPGSNYSANVDLLAPGKDITAAVPAGSPCLSGGAYCTFSGTSAAAPHVAGAFALFRQIDPQASISRMLAALNCTGLQVDRSELSRPRIDLLKARAEFLATDPSQDYRFDDPADADAFAQRHGTWSVAEGKLKLASWPTSGGDYDWAIASHRYCSSSFRVRALMERTSGSDGQTGILLASNIQRIGPTLVASGYALLYNFYRVIVIRLDNFPLRANAGIVGTGAGNICQFTPPGWNVNGPHIVQFGVRGDGRYSVSIDLGEGCTFLDRFHPPPSKVAVIASRRSNEDDASNRVEVNALTILPLN